MRDEHKLEAFCRALALESASDLTYDADTDTWIATTDELVRYARIVAYKVAYNMSNGFLLNPAEDPLTYIDCDGDTPDEEV